AAPPPHPIPQALPALSPASLGARWLCSRASRAGPPVTPVLTRRASRSTGAPAFPPHVASILHSAVITLHPGRKTPTPQVGQVPYVRVSLTASPPVVCR